MPWLTITRLIEGDPDIVGYYRKASQIWAGMLDGPEADNAHGLAAVITANQIRFERECGGGSRSLGQEVMVAVGIGQFFSGALGFGENYVKAQMVKEAFSLSGCSAGIKGDAGQVADLFGLVT
jgi:hypothetical protein